jgi:hypothetical protein
MSTSNSTNAITVPSIHSNDRDERIAARRQRIKSRNEQRALESEGTKGTKRVENGVTFRI